MKNGNDKIKTTNLKYLPAIYFEITYVTETIPQIASINSNVVKNNSSTGPEEKWREKMC